MEPGSQPANGSRIEYGQTMGRMGDVGSPGSVHAHVEAPAPVFERYINDITSGRIQSNGAAVSNPAVNADPMADGVLRRNEQGAAVTKLQEDLTKAGFSTQGADGKFGQNTEDAVKRYQTSRGLESDGIAGQATLKAINENQPAQQQQPTTPPTSAPAQQTPTQQPSGNRVSGGPNDFGSSSPLGTLISSGEGGYDSYNRGRAGDANGAQIDFSQMTVGEVMRRQDLAGSDPNRLFAVGKYQMIPGTFEETANALGIDRNAKLTPQLQERMFADYLVDEKRPQVKAYITGETNGAQGLQGAQLALAREFASVADPRTGRSVYDGDSAGNSASITSAEVGTALNQMRGQYQQNISSGMNAAEAYRSLSGDPNIQGQTQNGQIPTPTPQTQTQTGALADNMLRRGEEGPEVKKLQEDLTKAGFSTQGADSKFGQNTEDAVKRYQEARGLQADGIAGPATLAALSAQPAPIDKPQTPPTAADKPQTAPAAGNGHGHSHDHPLTPQTAAANAPTAPAPATGTPQTPTAVTNTQATPAQTDKPLISSANHPDNKLYQQAVSNLEQLGPSGGFKSREDLEKAAAAVAADAKATGLKDINHITKTNAPDGQTFLVATQGDPINNPASKRSYIDYGQATSQTVAQSTSMAEGKSPATQVAAQPTQQTEQPQQEPIRIAASR